MITAWQQLSTKACTQTKRIAVVRIHVERAIQRLKGYKILQGIFFQYHWSQLLTKLPLFVPPIAI